MKKRIIFLSFIALSIILNVKLTSKSNVQDLTLNSLGIWSKASAEIIKQSCHGYHCDMPDGKYMNTLTRTDGTSICCGEWLASLGYKAS